MAKKMGIIGYGNMGSWHAKQVKDRIGGLDVIGIYDIDPARCALAEENGLTAYPTAEALLKSGIDLVVVATPNNFHKEYCIMAMEMGVNVLCEKPACLSCEELEEVIAVSNRTGKLYTVHQNRRFDPDYAIMKNIIKSGMIGKPYALDSRLYSSRGCSNAWRSTYANGGGALYDWGIHMIDQVLCLLEEEPSYVSAQLQSVRYAEVDDVCHVTIGFPSGVCARVTIDFWCYVEEPRWHLSCDDGTATIYQWFGTEGKIIKGNTQIQTVPGCVYTANGLSTTMWPRPKQEIVELQLPVPETPPRWEDFYENILDVIDGMATQFVTHDQIRRSMKVVMAALESSRTKQVVHL